MRKLLIVLPTLLALAGGCDATRRDFSVCDQHYSDCLKGFTCNQTTGMCVRDTDASTPDIPDTATTPDTSSPVDVSEADTKDAPVTTDATPMDIVAGEPAVADATPIVDVAIPDTRIPDAAETCSVDNDCVGVPTGAYCGDNKRCVACTKSSQCNNDAGLLICSAQNTCVPCTGVSGPDGGSACPPSAPVCAATGGCVQCVKNSDCPTAGKAFCVKNQCVGCDSDGATASAADGGAPDGGPTGPCTGATPVCVPSTSTTSIAGRCVGCVNNGDCSGNTPICNTTSNTCAACTSDSQCTSGPGVCMFHQDPSNGGGRCAADSETIYVKNSATCTTGLGTSLSPYCDPQVAINNVTTKRRVVVIMSGAAALNPWQVSSPGPQVSVIAPTTAIVTPGASIGIHVSNGGDVYVRGLTVQGGTVKAGIVVDAGCTLALDRCIVKGNTGGGLIVQFGANFDIANSVFDGNGTGYVGTTTSFGGVYLGGGAPKTGPNRFWFSTIVNNDDRGIICYDTSQTLFGMLMTGNHKNGDYLSCTMDKTSVWSSGQTSPDLTTSYANQNFLVLDGTDHLSANHRCRDLIDPSTPHPFDDIDGDVRPKPANGRLDCGADEY